jgi:hypothetical protein
MGMPHLAAARSSATTYLVSRYRKRPMFGCFEGGFDRQAPLMEGAIKHLKTIEG